MSKSSKRYSPLGERLLLQHLIRKYGWICAQPWATPEDDKFIERCRGQLQELTPQLELLEEGV